MTSDAGPVARALLALDLIQRSPGVTADRLATEIGVSAWAARRYVPVLREAGIPVESERGSYGGYRVGRGLRLPPLVFTATEALGVVMAVLDGHHDAADASGIVGGGLSKIVRALPEAVAAQAEGGRRGATAAPDRAAARPDPETTTALVQACSDRQRVRIRYRSEGGSEWDAEVDPWAVVVRHGRWYLLCHAHAAGALRAYRIDRVRCVEMLAPRFTPPSDLDSVALLEEHLAAGWEYDTEVVIDAPRDSLVPRVPRVLGRLEVVDAGTTRLVGSTSDPWWYAWQLAGLRASYRILGSGELRDAASAVGRRLLASAGERA